MGKGRSSRGGSASAETSLSREQARIAREIFERTANLRGGVIAGAERRLGLPISQSVTGFDRGGRPIFGPAPESGVAFLGPQAPEREALELGFTGAREDILSRVPGRGGQMNRLLTDVELNRARGIGGMEAAATDRALSFATGTPFAAPGQAITGLSNAAQQAGLAANREWQQQQAKDQQMGTAGLAVGSTLKKAASSGFGLCWVALALYGDGMRFRLARSWIFDHWQGRSAEIIRSLYLAFGLNVAWIVQQSCFSRKLIKPFFDLAVRKELEFMRNG